MKDRGFAIEDGYDIISSEPINERLISLQLCNNNLTDDVLYDFITFAGADTIVTQLQLRQEWSGDLT